jgi:hypothetical protein
LVILIIAVAGLPLYRRSLRLQLILLLLITAVLLLLGVFLPELARTVLSSIFPIALAVVVVIWLIGHVSKMRWRMPRRRPPVVAPGATPFAAESGTPVATEATGAAEAVEAPVAEDTSRAESPPDAEGSPAKDETGSEEEGGRRDA